MEKSLKWAEPILKEHTEKMKGDTVSTDKEPHMLHVVYLIQQLNGRPWWEKKIIEQLQLDGPVCMQCKH